MSGRVYASEEWSVATMTEFFNKVSNVPTSWPSCDNTGNSIMNLGGNVVLEANEYKCR